MEIVIHIFAGIGVIVVGVFIIGSFMVGLQDNKNISKTAIRGILATKGWTYKELWKRTYGNKRIICLEDLTYQQMIELIVISNKLLKGNK